MFASNIEGFWDLISSGWNHFPCLTKPSAVRPIKDIVNMAIGAIRASPPIWATLKWFSNLIYRPYIVLWLVSQRHPSMNKLAVTTRIVRICALDGTEESWHSRGRRRTLFRGRSRLFVFKLPSWNTTLWLESLTLFSHPLFSHQDASFIRDIF